ncbi:MAG TPA: hypothetical protein VEY12_11210, partial [Thermoplasmata archaeon]|nr:hypothetical protein [Thermoplasmata archaeon]
DSGGLYRLDYTGFDTSGNVQVGVATSRDLQNWTRFPLNPVLAAGASGSWDTHVSTHSVVLLGSEWIAYYEGAQPGGNGQIGSATSLDGYNWTKNPANPTIPPEPAPAWDDLGLGTPDLLLDPSGPRIYYNGGNGGPFRIGLYRFGPPRAETYSGWYVSAVFDSREAGTIWHSLAANATAVPGTSVSFRARAGNTSTPTGTWTTWTPSARLTSLPPTRFLQVRADFLSDAWNTTAFLTKISVDYGPNVPGGAAEGTVLGIPIWSLFLLALVAGVGVVTVVVVLLSLRGERRRPPMG